MFHVKHSEISPEVRGFLESQLSPSGVGTIGAGLARFAELLAKHAASRGLLSKSQRDEQAIWNHILDSLQALALPAVRQVKSIIDAGSGGGLPGIPIALAKSESQVLLVERSAAKAEFLELAKTIVPVPNVRVLCREVREVYAENSDSIVIARAFLKPVAWQELVTKWSLTATWIIFATDINRSEWETAARNCGLLSKAYHEYSLPGSTAKRFVTEFGSR
jgi:16S rRNA (guanine527-N7)-methyltransferase